MPSLDELTERFQENEERLDTFVNGDSSQSFITPDGQSVPSIQKFLGELEQELYSQENGYLAQIQSAASTATAKATEAAGSAATASTKATDAAASATAAATSAAAALNAAAAWNFVIEDQKTANSSGGAASAGTWNSRALNTIVQNTIGATLSANAFTLPAGTYEIEWDAPCYFVTGHKSKLRNETDSLDVAFGTNEHASNATGGSATRSLGRAQVTLTGPKAFKIYSYTVAANANGLGAPIGLAPEIYTRVRVKKLA